MIAETRRMGDTNRAPRSNFHFRLDNVFVPIALAGGHVTGEGIAGKGRGGNVVGTADATFEHAAAPRGNVVTKTESLNLAGTGVAAHPAELDVHDPSGAQFDGRLCVARVADAFVQAERSLDQLLQ